MTLQLGNRIASYVVFSDSFSEKPSITSVQTVKKNTLKFLTKLKITTKAKTEKSEQQETNPDLDPFLKILHQDIFSKEIYPANALFLHQTGVVTIRMLINHDGQISQLSILKSSQIKSIDDAALNAVAAISPVREASEYLKQAKVFAINIVFS